MDSSKTLRNSSQTNSNIIHYQAMKSQGYYYSSPSSTSSSNNDIIDNSLLSTPSSTPARFSGGVPFSWEHFPGIPKKQLSKNPNDEYLETTKTKPLMPPPTISPEDHVVTLRVKKNTSFSTTTITTNPNNITSFYTKHQNKYFETDDPFFAALVECSKDDRLDDHQNHRDRGGREIISCNNNMNSARFWSLATAKVSRSLSDRFGIFGIYSSCKRTCSVAESIGHLPRSTRRSYDLINNRPR